LMIEISVQNEAKAQFVAFIPQRRPIPVVHAKKAPTASNALQVLGFDFALDLVNNRHVVLP